MRLVLAGFVLAGLVLALSLPAQEAGAQEIQLNESHRLGGAPQHNGYVILLSEAFTVRAGEPQIVALHLRVDPGFHINSHRPTSELLIPTSVSFEPSPQVRVADVQYPAGTPFRFGQDPTANFDVYSGVFALGASVKASAGEHTLHGTLHYQACDDRACYPPKSYAFSLLLTAR